MTPHLSPTSGVEYVGPFQHHDLVVDGRKVPFITVVPVDGGKVDIGLDRRIGIELTVAEAERFLPFLAHAIAIASGYTSHPDTDHEPNPSHPFPRVTGLHFGGKE